MIVASLLQRLCRNLTVRDVTAMSVGERTRVFDALNNAVKDWFTDAPAQYRINEESTEIFGPLKISLNVTADSTAVTFNTSFPTGGYANTAALVGKAVIIQGDGGLNRFQSDGVLLKAYLGSTGPVNATVYFDTVAFGSSDWSVIGNPIWHGVNMANSMPLLPWSGGWNGWMEPMDASFNLGFLGAARPQFWWTGTHMPSTSQASPYWYLYMWPLSGVKGTLTYKAEFIPPMYGLADLATQRDVPVPDAFIPMLCYLAQQNLMGSVHWNPACDRKSEEAALLVARGELRRLSATSTDSSPRSFGTPYGY